MDVIEKIVIYKGKFTLVSEFSSGSSQEFQVSDHPLVRSTMGQVILRGESLSGLLRSELVRLFGYCCKDYEDPGSQQSCDCAVCGLMGHSRIPDELTPEEELRFHSSRLKVTGGVFNESSARIRHGVAIGRSFQVAAEHKKYDLEALQPNAKAPFEFEIENPSEDELLAIDRFLTELKLGLISLGGKKGAGLGLVDVTYNRFTFCMNQKASVLNYLKRAYPEADPEPTGLIEGGASKFSRNWALPFREGPYRGWRLMLPFDMIFPELFLVNDPLEAACLGSDHVSVVDAFGSPWLPPSTIRGVLRSRAEQIIRTLNPSAACDPTSDEPPMRSCGSGIDGNKKQQPENWLSFDKLEDPTFLCLGCQLFGLTHAAGRVRVCTGKYEPLAGKDNNSVLQHFLAICRFKGGGKDKAKFDAYPLYNATFRGCGLLLEDFYPWQAGLLALVMKDLLQADLRIGFGSRKGFGQARGCLPMDGELILSGPDKMYTCRLGELLDDSASSKLVKDWLEEAVVQFRDIATHYKGVSYAAA